MATAITITMIIIYSNPNPMSMKYKSFLAFVFQCYFQEAIRNICNIESYK